VNTDPEALSCRKVVESYNCHEAYKTLPGTVPISKLGFTLGTLCRTTGMAVGPLLPPPPGGATARTTAAAAPSQVSNQFFHAL